MPIIESITDQTISLSQGDILRGVSLFVTHEPWGEDGGSGKKTEHPLGLVLSRPCAAAHKNRVAVAVIEKYKNPPPEFEDFDHAHEFFRSTIKMNRQGAEDAKEKTREKSENGRFNRLSMFRRPYFISS